MDSIQIDGFVTAPAPQDTGRAVFWMIALAGCAALVIMGLLSGVHFSWLAIFMVAVAAIRLKGSLSSTRLQPVVMKVGVLDGAIMRIDLPQSKSFQGRIADQAYAFNLSDIERMTMSSKGCMTIDASELDDITSENGSEIFKVKRRRAMLDFRMNLENETLLRGFMSSHGLTFSPAR